MFFSMPSALAPRRLLSLLCCESAGADGGAVLAFFEVVASSQICPLLFSTAKVEIKSGNSKYFSEIPLFRSLFMTFPINIRVKPTESIWLFIV